jgi:hypothetical protein
MDVIETIKDEMLCGNNCPQYHQSPYDIEKCKCYKKQVIAQVLRLKNAYADMLDSLNRDGTIITRLMAENKHREDYEKFYLHIQNHLSQGEPICKICGKNLKEILEQS